MSRDPRVPMFRTPAGAASVAGLALAAAAMILSQAEAGLPGLLGGAVRALVWADLMLLPGIAVYLCVERARLDATDALLTSLVLSPVLVAGISMAVLVAGGSRTTFAGIILAAPLLILLAGSLRANRPVVAPPRREFLALLLLVGATIILIGVLPATREWWRIRSDAWFHAAVAMQIRDFGAPPEDPYFTGMGLQYMWAYHALVIALGDHLRLDYFRVMALVNLHALALLGVAAYRLASVFRTGIAPRMVAVATTLFAFNAAFWVFLPLKAAKAFIGEVRGVEELARTFALTPLHYQTSYAFLDIYRNPEWFLDKYMVATAFGLALSLMLAALAAACSYLSTPRRTALTVLGVSAAGSLWFHTYVGLIAVATLLGALGALFVFRKGIRGYAVRQSLSPALAVILAVAASAPFLYNVLHGKDSGGESALSLSMARAVSILIPCALVFVLAWRERTVRSDASVPARFLLFSALVALVPCLLIRLPGVNDVDKPAFPVFLTVAVVAGFAIADSCTRRTGKARFAAAALWIVLFALPVNTIALAGCFGTPNGVEVTTDERAVADWAREDTPRNAVFIDDPERVFLVVAGPRRYLFGAWHYASQWKYPRAEMARRLHVVRSLYAAAPLDSVVLGLLSEPGDPMYVIARPGQRAAGAAVCADDTLFPVVFDDGTLQVRAVDRRACQGALGHAAPPPSEGEMIRASGL